ncbi:hypothetical protein PFISCL1PPCAC_5629 [Pristionchus fissidentatus]|uniref:Uncharacterized protein n=1 Tax=Pristionchus fissidentatus TaxID=1538716 RepID=A0AAV5V404_9BILA|nr:hypothetical protein PFISCL1PPCAC_5629 [Pristionchus fissidentatus]
MDDFCITDRHRLATELIAALPQSELNHMFPPCLRDKSHQEIFNSIKELLECMSKDRIEALLKGEVYTSGEEEEEEAENGEMENTVDIESDDTVEEDDCKSEERTSEVEEEEEEEEEVESEEEEIQLIPLSPEGNRDGREEGEVKSSPEYSFSP